MRLSQTREVERAFDRLLVQFDTAVQSEFVLGCFEARGVLFVEEVSKYR